MRDDFPKEVKERVAKRAGMRCSNPDCRAVTAGPDSADGAVNLGEAGHITAASSGGARFDNTLSSEQRRGIENAIWLCRRCAKLVDADEIGFPKSKLLDWKETAEHIAALEMRGFSVSRGRSFANLERMMPELIAEMRADLKQYPLRREFAFVYKRLTYSFSNHEILVYKYEDHSSLDSKAQILENYGAAINISANQVKRYNFAEAFVEYLLQS